MKKPKTLFEKYKAIQKIGTEVEMPWELKCFLAYEGKPETLSIMGNQVYMGGDYQDLSTARSAVEWLVAQLGGTVQWEPED